ncbi:molybdenum cofactor guanylyltransferase, partial [Gemmatimonadota bacterium]
STEALARSSDGVGGGWLMIRGGESRSGSFLGVILAGGESRRYGRPKALAPFGGQPMGAWARDALVDHCPRTVTISHDPAVSRTLGIPGRQDRVQGIGPLGGLLSGLEWAREEKMLGLFLLACDIPLVGSGLVGRILDAWVPGAHAVVPESPGPLGFEPLCAVYASDCLPFVEERVASQDRSLAALLERIQVTTVPQRLLGSREDVSLAFRNVNTPEDGRELEARLAVRRGLPRAVRSGLSGMEGFGGGSR